MSNAGRLNTMVESGKSKTRTALVLLSIVLVFFFGIMLKVWLFGR